MKAVVVYNSQSGSAMPLAELKTHFKDAEIEIVKTIDITKNMKKKLRPYIGQRKTIIAGYGGDGTISNIADILAGSNTVLAPLPGGTLNHFTKDLGISQNLDEALTNLKKSKPMLIDVARVNERIFLNNSAIGLYPSALQMRDEMTRKVIGKWPAAIIASLKAFIRYRSYEVEIDGESLNTPFIFVGNNDYQVEDRLIGDRPRLDQGILSVYAVNSANRWDVLKILAKALIGKLESSNEVKIWKTNELAINTNRHHVRISRDGEHERMKSPLKYKIIPGGLKIIGSSQN